MSTLTLLVFVAIYLTLLLSKPVTETSEFCVSGTPKSDGQNWDGTYSRKKHKEGKWNGEYQWQQINSPNYWLFLSDTDEACTSDIMDTLDKTLCWCFDWGQGYTSAYCEIFAPIDSVNTSPNNVLYPWYNENDIQYTNFTVTEGECDGEEEIIPTITDEAFCVTHETGIDETEWSGTYCLDKNEGIYNNQYQYQRIGSGDNWYLFLSNSDSECTNNDIMNNSYWCWCFDWPSSYGSAYCEVFSIVPDDNTKPSDISQFWWSDDGNSLTSFNVQIGECNPGTDECKSFIDVKSYVIKMQPKLIIFGLVYLAIMLVY